MLKLPAQRDRENGDWADRSEFWANFKLAKKPGRQKKYNHREPLILCGHGAHIRVDHNTLLVRNGFTHYPQEQEAFRFFPGDANLPNRIVMIDGSGGITFDALSWMADQQIEFLKLDWRGEVSTFSGLAFVANPKLVEMQREIRASKRQLEIARELISEKIANSTETLEIAIPKSEKREIAIRKLREWHSKLSRMAGSISTLLGVEGQTAGIYFSAWHGTPLNWKGLGKKPIPKDWLSLGTRSMNWRRKARSARHPVNAMLNYGYGILKHRIRSQVIAAGYDPTIGFLHGNSGNKSPLVYDLMEPFRPVVDALVLDFALSTTFQPGDFTINEWGGCRLNPQMAGSLVRSVMTIAAARPITTLLRQADRKPACRCSIPPLAPVKSPT